MSLKPGIAHSWFDKFYTDVYPHDYVVVNGKTVRPPKFYDRCLLRLSLLKYEASDPNFKIEYDEIMEKRVVDAEKRLDDNTVVRLAAKEAVTQARVSKLKRNLL